MHFPVLPSPQKHIQIKITNYHFYLFSLARTINIRSATHVPHTHTFAVESRLAPYCGAVRTCAHSSVFPALYARFSGSMEEDALYASGAS